MTEEPVASEKFRAKIEERRLREALDKPPEVTASPEFRDLVPDTGIDRSEEDQELDRFIDGIDIIDAYIRWCGKSMPHVGVGQTESIMVSCPVPTHPDKNPSAWINSKKKTWFCGTCQIGGDVYDIAAYRFGYPVPGYKDGIRFHQLRRDMAGDYGYSFVRVPGAAVPLMVPPSSESEETTEEPTTLAPVVELHDEEQFEVITYPSLNWRAVVPPDTFLDRWMQQTTIDDVPEEYHFWHGMIAISLALGRDVTLYDSHPVLANLFVCILGQSGSGKSKSRNYLDLLLREALPYDSSMTTSKGTKIIGSPASAEALVGQFSKPIYDDPGNPKAITGYGAVRGLVDFNELSSLMGRTQRQGNVLKPNLMEFYDGRETVSTISVTHGEKEARSPFCCALTTTQPLVIKRLVTQEDADSGFLNRWVFAAGPLKERQAIGGVKVDVTPAVDPLRDIAGWAAAGFEMQWDADAIQLVQLFFRDTLWPERDKDETGLLTRMDLLFKKLCLLLSANLHQTQVTVGIVQCVISMYRYLLECYSIPGTQIGTTLQSEVRNAILWQVKKAADKGKGMTASEINKSLKRRNYPLDLLVRVLDYMTQLGEIELRKANTGTVGRPTVRYHLVG